MKNQVNLKAELPPILREMAALVIDDPGADVHPADTRLWMELFIKAERLDRELFAKLRYVRGGGAKLIRHSKFGYVTQPVLTADWTQEVYDRERQCLMPYRDMIIELLGVLK